MADIICPVAKGKFLPTKWNVYFVVFRSRNTYKTTV